MGVHCIPSTPGGDAPALQYFCREKQICHIFNIYACLQFLSCSILLYQKMQLCHYYFLSLYALMW